MDTRDIFTDIKDVAKGDFGDLFNQTRNNLRHLDTDLTNQRAQYINSQPDTILGENPNQGASPTADNGANGQMDKVRQAQAQGRMSGQEALIRYSNIVQTYINKDPGNAQYYRERAQMALGFVPGHELAKGAAIDAEQQRTTKNALITQSFQNGIGYFNKDGSIDEQRTAQAGMQQLATEYQFKQMALQKSLAKDPLSHDQAVAADYQGIVKGLDPMFEDQVQGTLTALPSQLSKLSTAGDQNAIENLHEQVGQLRAAWNNTARRMVGQSGADPDAIDKSLKYYDGYFDTMEQMFSGPASHVTAVSNTFKTAKEQLGLGAITIMPKVAALQQAGGDAAVGAIMQSIVLSQKGMSSEIGSEISAYMGSDLAGRPQAPSSAESRLQTSTEVMTGQRDFSQMTPRQRSESLTDSISAINAMAANPNGMQPQELNTFGRVLGQTAKLANQSSNPDDLVSAALMLSDPNKLRALDRFSNDPNTSGGQEIGNDLLEVNQKALVGVARNGTLSTTVQKPVPNSFPIITRGGDWKERTQPQQIQAVFNPQTGRLEVPAGEQVAPDMIKSIQTANKLLDNVDTLKTYSGGAISTMNTLQAKQYMVDGMGLDTREDLGHVQYKLDAPKPKPAKGEGVSDAIDVGAMAKKGIDALSQPGTPSGGYTSPDDVKTAVRSIAKDEGVPEDIAMGLIEQESNFGNQKGGFTNRPVSPTGAVGFGQITSIFAKQYGSGLDVEKPGDNIRMSLRGLAAMKEHYGTWKEALKHYGDPKQTTYADEVLGRANNYR